MRKNSPISKKLLRQLILLVVAGCSALFGWQYQANGGSASGNDFEGQVVAVSDGDTIKVLSPDRQEVKVRFAFIDAPEKKQAYGMKAKQSLSDLVFGKVVRVKVTDTDRYGRKVAVIYLKASGGEQDINLTQVQRGFAWHYIAYAKKTQPSEEFADYEAAQSEATAGRIGLWADADAIPPWEFRHPK